jgi:hypothetical protein
MLKKKTLSVIIVLAFLVGTTLGVMGASTIKDVKAQIDSAIKVKLDGQNFEPANTKGQKINPIIYDSKYYIPIKDFSEVLNIAYSYDTNSKTIFLGDKIGAGINLTSLKNSKKDYWVDISNTVDSTTLTHQKDELETVFKSGIFFKETYGSGSSWGKITYDFSNKYQTLKFNAWSTNGNATLKIIDVERDLTLKEILLTDRDLNSDIEVNVGGVKSLRIESYQNGKVNVILADAHLT